MPKARRPTARAGASHTDRPSGPQVLIEGGARPLPVRVADSPLPPLGVLWIDGRTGALLSHAVVDPAQSRDRGKSEALQALEQALESPLLDAESAGAAGDSSDPAATHRHGLRLVQPTVVRTDAFLAGAASSLLRSRGIRVEESNELPLFDQLFEQMANSLAGAASEVESEPFAWEIDTTLLPPLFKAAAEFGRRAPWTYMLDHPPIAVVLGPHTPLPGVDTLYGSVLGAGREVYGIAFYLSLDEYRQALRQGVEMEIDDEDFDEIVEDLRRTGAPVDMMPRDLLRGMAASLYSLAGEDRAPSGPPEQECLVCFFDPEEETDPSYVEWLEEHNISFEGYDVPTFLRTGHDFEPREPNEPEVQALTLALAATNQFLVAHRQSLRQAMGPPPGGLRHTAHIGGKKRGQAIEVLLPPPGYDVDADLDAVDAEP